MLKYNRPNLALIAGIIATYKKGEKLLEHYCKI